MEKERAIVLGFANQKGGVGKSTLTHLTAKTLGLNPNGKKVLVIEVDKQATLTDARSKYVNDGVSDFPYDLIKCELSDFDSHLSAKNFLKYDFIFLDMPGTLDKDGITIMLVQADILFIPLSPSAYDTNSTASFIEEVFEIQKKREELELPFDYYTIINKVKSGTKAGRELIATLEDYKINLFDTTITDYEAYKEHSVNFNSIIGSKIKHSYEFEKFIDEFFDKIKKFKLKNFIKETSKL